MALSQAAALVEKVIGHGNNANTEQDLTNPARDRAKYADPNDVPKPRVVEPRDVILKGDRVVASFQIACGDCYYCKKKQSSQCEKTNSNTMEQGMYGGRTAGMFGHSHFTGGFARGQAEYVMVPYGDVNLLKLPSSVPDEKGLCLSDVICTSWNCVVDTGIEKDDVVAIWGAGPIGQMCADFAFMNGASRVIMIDSNWRLEYVKSKIPKVELLDYSALPRGTSVTSKLKEMVPRGPDVALESYAWMETDTSEIVNEMITSVKNFGRCGITGVYVGYTNHFNIGALMERGEKLCKMIESREIEPLKMVSHRVDISELDEVYYKFERKEDGLQKVFVQTRFSAPPAPGSPSLTTYKK
ncbi:GroES-like protein [Acephala macrosclerotiorum]|nr:GroES-like protein [Acephala macrosclerotiorum]